MKLLVAEKLWNLTMSSVKKKGGEGDFTIAVLGQLLGEEGETMFFVMRLRTDPGNYTFSFEVIYSIHFFVE